MNKRYLLLIISAAGLLISGYLLFAYVSPVPLVCDSTGGCHTVQASKWSSFFGIPTPLYGVAFYATLAILVALRKDQLVRYITVIGFIVSAYLSYLEAFVIEAWCLWCVGSAVIATLAMIVAWFYKEPSSLNQSQSI